MKTTPVVLKIGILSKRKITFQINSKVVETGDYLVTISPMKAARRGVPVAEERSECVCVCLTFQSEITNWQRYLNDLSSRQCTGYVEVHCKAIKV